MKDHLLISAMLSALLSAPAVAADGKWQMPRTADGHPDLQGVWTNATITPLERPKEFGERLVISDAEAKAIESQNQQFNDDADAPTDPNTRTQDLPNSCGLGFTGADCGYNNFWIDRGQAVIEVNGERRSSLIVAPKDGRVPLLPERQKLLTERFMAMRTNFDGPEVRPLAERCLLSFGSSSGPPMLPVLYNNHYQIVQNRDSVLILVEMVHDARIVRLNGKASGVPKWMGDSVGRWEGDTLVVETSNFTDKESFRGSTAKLKITERFTRVSADKINYRVTLDDPVAFSQPWTAEYPFYATNEPIYEYACHEGNYALPGILAGAREDEKRKRQASASTASK
ncbi:hypothetical protein [Steroidobacter sp.]|uniref:hypothetical protein n=1 Tax=Steroidobacter sp. TaxID=1978227 RepID=UPI001A4BD935|nr:hypothetical protein [Steroidobacter sp.]MBL8269112.1 hypothetical protein [Steroidobacter sp.]